MQAVSHFYSELALFIMFLEICFYCILSWIVNSLIFKNILSTLVTYIFSVGLKVNQRG